MRRLPLLLVLLAAVLALAAPDALAQCALCKENLRKGGDARLIQGFYISILMLLSAPVVLFATIGGLIFRAHRRKLAAPPEATPCAARS